jgi:Ser/Thr protein kinase RdoA (MazF antagonist)
VDGSGGAGPVRGLSPADAQAVVGELAALHAACWESPALASLDWLNRNTAKSAEFTADLLAGLYGGFVERYAGQLEARTLSVLDGFVPRAGAYLAAGADADADTLSHGDCRADNLMLGGGRRPVLVDWQTCRMGAGISDLSYFLESSLLVDDRRAHEEPLVRRYHEVLTAGGARLDWADCWDQYRRFAFGGIVTAVVASMIVKRTDRGDQMFCAMTNRHAAHALDLDSLSLLR